MEVLVQVKKTGKGLDVEVKTDLVTAVAAIHCIAAEVAEKSGLSVEAVLRSAMIEEDKKSE